MRDVITTEQFERAREDFDDGWHAEDDRQQAAGTQVPGARTTAGLTAALASLNITVSDEQPNALASRTATSVRVFWETKDWTPARLRAALVDARLRADQGLQ